MKSFHSRLIKSYPYNHARVIEVTTAHGVFTTPVFMAVGTRAGVNNLTPIELKMAGAQIILGGNTYHMLCKPGLDIIKKSGGMHRFMGWNGPMLTDSGGFQVFSLAKKEEFCIIDDDGANFNLPKQADDIHMTPEVSLAAQKIIGADIIMAFDQCTPDHASFQDAQIIMQRTHQWLDQAVRYHTAHPLSAYNYPQALFGIIQGGVYYDLRRQSAEFVSASGVTGVALGGETIGFNMPKTIEILSWVRDLLPDDKPCYTMGVGMGVQDLFDVVAAGADMFDCVAPTRNARHGSLYSGEIVEDKNWLHFTSRYPQGRLQIKKKEFAVRDDPIMLSCTCYTCRNFSQAYLHHLFKQKAGSFTALASIHNVHVMNEACTKMRNLILQNY